jgi:hypothetical protein
MAKSFTKKEKTLAGKLVVDVAMRRAEAWLRDEFEQIRNNPKYPVIAPNPDSKNVNSWVIGRFQLDRLNNHMWHLTNGDRIDYVFYDRKAAILYAILTQQQQFNSADAIVKLDQRVAKQKQELTYFSTRMTNKKAPAFNLQLYETRYVDSKIKYTAAKQELEKTLNHAKYNKVWDLIL